MLDSCDIVHAQELVFRLVSVHESKKFDAKLLARGAEPEQLDEIKSILKRSGSTSSAEDIIDSAFLPSKEFSTDFPSTRFSDGTFGVYYSALEENSCKREVEYHIGREIIENNSESIPYTRHYHLISCDYSGTTADLRGREVDHAELVSQDRSGYPFCQALAVDARNSYIDGFFTPSARQVGGTCVPVFARPALSDPKIGIELKLIPSEDGVIFQ